jgi:hypothetical protein
MYLQSLDRNTDDLSRTSKLVLGVMRKTLRNSDLRRHVLISHQRKKRTRAYRYKLNFGLCPREKAVKILGEVQELVRLHIADKSLNVRFSTTCKDRFSMHEQILENLLRTMRGDRRKLDSRA